MSVPHPPENLATIRHAGPPRFQIVGIEYRPEKHVRQGIAHADHSNYRTVVNATIDFSLYRQTLSGEELDPKRLAEIAGRKFPMKKRDRQGRRETDCIALLKMRGRRLALI
jgi:hypothetical protein